MQFTSQLEQGDWYVMAGWLCVVSALLLYGLGIALSKIWSRLPLRRWRPSTARARAQLALVRRPGERPRAATQIASNSHWSRVREIVETGVHRTEAMSAWHAAAGRQIDAAEYALNGLIADCAKVMRMPASAAPATPRPLPRPAQAPLTQPLAA